MFLLKLSLTEFHLQLHNANYAQCTVLGGLNTAADETEKYLSSWSLHLKSIILCATFLVFQNSRASDQESLKAMLLEMI